MCCLILYGLEGLIEVRGGGGDVIGLGVYGRLYRRIVSLFFILCVVVRF